MVEYSEEWERSSVVTCVPVVTVVVRGSSHILPFIRLLEWWLVEC